MVLIRESLSKAARWHTERECGVFWVPAEQVTKTYRGIPIGTLSQLWPEDYLRREAMTTAKFWVGTKEQRGYELVHAPDDILLWGPYHHRDWPGAAQASGIHTVGRAEAELADAEYADFLLYAVWKTPRVVEMEDYDLVIAAAKEKREAYDQYVAETNAKHDEMERQFA